MVGVLGFPTFGNRNAVDLAKMLDATSCDVDFFRFLQKHFSIVFPIEFSKQSVSFFLSGTTSMLACVASYGVCVCFHMSRQRFACMVHLFRAATS